MSRKRELPMVKLETSDQISITLVKRRQGLFNKAEELCRLCNAQVAVLVRCPASSKVFAFGHSSVDAVFDAFLRGTGTYTPPPPEVADDYNIKSAAFSLSEEIKALETEIGFLKKRKIGAELEEFSWVLVEFERFQSVNELETLVCSLQFFIHKATSKFNNPNSLMLLASGSTSAETITNSDDNSAYSTTATPTMDNAPSEFDNNIMALEPLINSPDVCPSSLVGQSSECEVDTSQIWTLPDQLPPAGIIYNGNNVNIPTSDSSTVGNEQYWIGSGSPPGFSCIDDNYVVHNSTDCNNATNPPTIPELASGFSHINNDKVNVFPTGNNDLCSPPWSPSSISYDFSNLFPTNGTTDGNIPCPSSSLLESVPNSHYNDYAGGLGFCGQPIFDEEYLKDTVADCWLMNESIWDCDYNYRNMDGNNNAKQDDSTSKINFLDVDEEFDN